MAANQRHQAGESEQGVARRAKVVISISQRKGNANESETGISVSKASVKKAGMAEEAAKYWRA